MGGHILKNNLQTIIMKYSFFMRFKKWMCLLLLALPVAPSEIASAATYQVGDVVTNFTFKARRQFTRPDGTVVPAGSPVRIRDFAGRVVFIEWFAVWCPYCTAAFPETKYGIEDWYNARGGNPYGVPVLYVFVDLEHRNIYQAATTTYINSYVYSNTPVCNDYDVPDINPGYPVRKAFQPANQPVFVAINCVTNSPTHQPWQVLVNHLGYLDLNFTNEIASFRAAIDAVQPPVVPPQLTNAHRVGADFEFNFQTQIGRSYRVLGSTNLTTWTALRTNAGSTNITTFRHTNAPSVRNFYRVVTP